MWMFSTFDGFIIISVIKIFPTQQSLTCILEVESKVPVSVLCTWTTYTLPKIINISMKYR